MKQFKCQIIKGLVNYKALGKKLGLHESVMTQTRKERYKKKGRHLIAEECQVPTGKVG